MWQGVAEGEELVGCVGRWVGVSGYIIQRSGWMQAIFKSSSDSFRPQSKWPHNCPFCRCTYTTSNHSFGSTNNIYLGSNEHMLMTFNPLKDELQPGYHSCRSRSSQRLSITFSYSNPLRLRKHRSAECSKFSTKRYKQQRFPLLSSRELKDEPPILQIVKNKAVPKLITSIENTPPKHQLLKINQIKSREKLGITSKQSKVDSQSDSHPVTSENEVKQDHPKHTPIHYLNYETSPTHPNASPLTAIPREQQSSLQLEPNYVTASQSRVAAPLSRTATQQEEATNRTVTKNVSQKYPTVKSIQVYRAELQHRQKESQERIISGNQIQRSKASETSLKIQERGEKWKKEVGVCQSDRELAQNLSQELLLHYDYFVVLPESDRSLSACLSL